MKRRHKYGAVPTEVDGIRFASKAEAKRYTELKLLERAKEIRNLVLQPRFQFTTIDGRTVTYETGRKVTYVGDFAYFEGGRRVVEDVKGMDTPASKIKRAMMRAFHNIDVRVIK